MSELSSKHALISGGGSGIGAEIARTLAHAGARVTILGRREVPLQEVASSHENIVWQTCDVIDPTSVRAAHSAAIEESGAVSFCIANAGSANAKPFMATTPKDMNAMLQINLLGVFNLFQVCLPEMKAQSDGRLIAIASTAGLKGYQYVSAYVAAKHGVVGLCRSLSLELAQDGITVNAICPGFIETPMLERSIDNIVEKTGMSENDARKSLMAGNPQRRFIRADEVAAAAVWLCSDAARSVNGHALSISGGEI